MSSKPDTKYVMGIFEYLTIILIVLKLTGLVDFTWAQALCPAIIAFSSGVVEGIIEAYQKDKENQK